MASERLDPPVDREQRPNEGKWILMALGVALLLGLVMKYSPLVGVLGAYAALAAIVVAGFVAVVLFFLSPLAPRRR